jgi:hypothetical protein
MALSELEIKHCEKLVAEFVSKRRPPPHVRAKLDLAFRVSGQSIEIFEIRPVWTDEGKMVEQSVAKATYNKRKLKWKVLWQRADIVQNDEYGCFFG